VGRIIRTHVTLRCVHARPRVDWNVENTGHNTKNCTFFAVHGMHRRIGDRSIGLIFSSVPPTLPLGAGAPPRSNRHDPNTVKLPSEMKPDGVIAIHWRTEETRANYECFSRFAHSPMDNTTVEELYYDFSSNIK